MSAGSASASATLTTEVTAEKHSYRQILKSSALIGGSSVANIVIGMVRTKAMAVLLGPAGVGLAGLYGSICDLVQSFAGMGVNSSGVRQIAEAAGSNDTRRIARTGNVLRRTSILLGLIGALFLIAFSRQVSILTFQSDGYAGPISLLSIAVFFRLVSAGQGALINGMRRIADLAKMNVLGAVFGTAISIAVVYFLREDGIVPSLILAAAMTIFMSWWYSRKIQIDTALMTASEIGQEATALLKLGVAFMATGLMAMGAAYIVRITVLRKLGVDSAGLYQSAWALGGLYVGFILQAMGADFYPRLTAVAHDNAACNRMVNEQARIGLLLGGPGVMGTLTLAPVILALFYSAKFSAAVEILRWIALGATLRVITWPMGYIILAKGRQDLFFWSELAWTVVNVSLTWVCISVFGLKGAGIAFFGSYIFHGCLIYPIVRSLSGFAWSRENKQTALFFLPLTAGVFCACFVLPFTAVTCVGIVAVIISGVYSIRVLLRFIPFELLPQPTRVFLIRLGFGASVFGVQ
jgi:O-antigen/teichoic acid export membrane protein